MKTLVEYNIGLAFLAQAERTPDLLAIITDQQMFTYTQLAKMVRGLAGKLSGEGVRRGSIVSLDSDQLLHVAPVMLATALVGGQWIAHKNYKVLSTAVSPTHFLRPAKDNSIPSGFIALTDDWFSAPAQAEHDEVDVEAPFVYLNTSGTTGTPKLLALSQKSLALRSYAVAFEFRERETVFCSLFSPVAFPYIARFLAALLNGATILHSRNIGLWYQAGVNHLYGSVAQVAEMLGQTILPRKIAMIQVSGSKCSDELARHLMTSFDEVVDLYASTETNRSYRNVKMLGPSGEIQTHGRHLDSEVEIVDDDSRPLPQGEIGLVRVRNPYLATGYLNNPEAQARSFRDGWFYSGDFGRFNEFGGLEILGRTGDVLNIGGVKVNALAVDEELRKVPGVADAMCFDLPMADGPNALLAFVIPASGEDFARLAHRIGQIAGARLARPRMPSRLIQTSTVPRAHDGGAQRFLCRQIYEARRSSNQAQEGGDTP
jgi:malonyl-CoA/methylmalonyl-CoA synthetase